MRRAIEHRLWAWRHRRAEQSLLRRAERVLDASRGLVSDHEDGARRLAALRQRPWDADTQADVLALSVHAARVALGVEVRANQVAAALALTEGRCVQLFTGEGKTLAGALAAVALTLRAEHVHVVTPNAYLARRDAAAGRPLFEFLGVRNACPEDGRDRRSRRRAYAARVIYGSASTLAFDFLRDQLRLDEPWQPPLSRCAALIDEADSILVDAAGAPFVISTQGVEASPRYEQTLPLLERLRRDIDFTVDGRARTVALTEEGWDQVEAFARARGWLRSGTSISDPAHSELFHVVHQGLRAHHVFAVDRDYLVTAGEVQVLDPWTGRTLPNRRFGGGLHQALEAKERVTVRESGSLLARVTVKGFFGEYQLLSGMSGTLQDLHTELAEHFGLEVIPLGPHKEVKRRDLLERTFATEREKMQALVEEVARHHGVGRPVLVGTAREEQAAWVSRLLRQQGIEHALLRARDHDCEAAIVAAAGRRGAVTVATQLAGRGTDIRMGGPGASLEEVDAMKDLGGLCVLGAERGPSRRVDLQLAGRAGRQGEPGSSQFFVSCEDELFERHADERTRSQLAAVREGSQSPDSVRLLAEHCQRRAEQRAYGARLARWEVDRVLEQQRRAFYALRKDIREGRHTVELWQSPPGREPKPPRALYQGVQQVMDRIVVQHRRTHGTLRPRVLRSELSRAWGLSLPRSMTPHDLEADLPRVAHWMATRMAAQQRRLRAMVDRVLVRLETQPDANARQAFLRESLGGLSELEDIEARDVVRARVQAVIDRRMRRFQPRRLLRWMRLTFLRNLDAAWAQHLSEFDALQEGVGWVALGKERPERRLLRDADEMLRNAVATAELRTLRSVLTEPSIGWEALQALEHRSRAYHRSGEGVAPVEGPQRT